MAWTSLISAFACALIIISGAYIVYDLNGGSLDLSNREVILVVSDSMDGDVSGFDVDSFPVDTLVMVKHLPDNEKRFLRIGEVISFYNGDRLIHHRIVETNMDNGFVIVHGDNSHSTERVLLNDINGVVVGSNHWLGVMAQVIMNNFLVFLGVLFVLCSLLVVYAIFIGPKKEVKANAQ